MTVVQGWPLDLPVSAVLTGGSQRAMRLRCRLAAVLLLLFQAVSCCPAAGLFRRCRPIHITRTGKQVKLCRRAGGSIYFRFEGGLVETKRRRGRNRWLACSEPVTEY